MSQFSLGNTKAAMTGMRALALTILMASAAFAQPRLAYPPASVNAVSTTPLLRWDHVEGATSYNIHVSTTPDFINFALTETTQDTSFTVPFERRLDPETTYYWRGQSAVGAVESEFSPVHSFTTYPNSIEVDVRRTPPGETSDANNYMLVGLPGEAYETFEAILGPSDGTNWTAYRDNGSDANYLIQYEGNTADFRLGSGRGYWLITSSDFVFKDDDLTPGIVDDIGLSHITLQDGWNVISNPFDVDVPWEDVVRWNDAGDLWAWNGTWERATTFESAVSGKAYYFFNPRDSQEDLMVPYPGSASTPFNPGSETTSLWLRVRDESGGRSTIQFIFDAASSFGPDPKDLVPPRGGPETLTMRVDAGDGEPLYSDARPGLATGQTYDILVTAPHAGRHAFNLSGEPDLLAFPTAILNLTTGDRLRFEHGSEISMDLAAGVNKLRFSVGPESFVNEAINMDSGAALRLLPPYPNPFSDRLTIPFSVPQEREGLTAEVFDATGRRVRSFQPSGFEGGLNRLSWDGRDASGTRLSAGIYLIRVSTRDQTTTAAVVLVPDSPRK